MRKLTKRRRIRLDKSKRSINQKVSQRKKMKKSTESIALKRRKINLKIKLKIDLLVRKNLRNDFY
jgi:hypothetical protein